MENKIQIRFNTEKDKTDASLPAWRVLINDTEFLAEEIEVEVPCWTTRDILSNGVVKWHISCVGNPVWEDKICRIKK